LLEYLCHNIQSAGKGLNALPSGSLMEPSTAELMSAVGHPLRRRILRAYLDGAVECASARELAATLDQRVEQVAYHLKTLAKGNILRPVQRADRERSRADSCCWALDVDATWLRLVLEVWVEVDLAG
jgi:DNA-binding transcriptional ArsR family regulator